MARLSPLALLHPTAPPRAGLVLGGGCPKWLVPDAAPDPSRAQLVVLAPTGAREWRPGWLAAAADAAAGCAAAGGVVVAWGGPMIRLRLGRLLGHRGLQPELTVVILPRASSRLVTPSVLRVHGAAAVLTGGLVLRKRDQPPALEWLGEHGQRAGGFTIRVSPRTGALLVECFDGSGAGSVIAKVSGGVEREHERLVALGQMAHEAGAAVPESRLLELPGATALVQAFVGGRVAARLLARGRHLEQVLELLAGWLERWGLLTRQMRELGETAAYRELLADLEQLAPLLDDRYAKRLRDRCSALAGVAVPVVAAHRDLTMWNVLVDGGTLGVVDWESATSDALPLVDFDYASVDALAAVSGYRDRVGAFAAVSEPVARLRKRLARTLAVPQEIRDLSAHACWLHHAANEQRRPEGSARPFLEIAKLNARR